MLLSISSVQLLSCVQLFVTPWAAAHQASMSITNSWSLLKLMSIELVMPSNHLILCRPLLLLPSEALCCSSQHLQNKITLSRGTCGEIFVCLCFHLYSFHCLICN